MTYEERKAQILAEIAARRKELEASDPYRARERERMMKRAPDPHPPYKYAKDTGEIAFPAAPCRGNRILCQHPKNTGFVSYTKQCRKESCLFFDAKT